MESEVSIFMFVFTNSADTIHPTLIKEIFPISFSQLLEIQLGGNQI